MAIIAGVMGALYSMIMQRPAHEYIPYLTVGFIAWNMLSALVADGTQVFVTNATAIKEIPVPCTIYVFRILWRNTLIFGHNLLVYIALLFIFELRPYPEIFLALPGFCLILLNGVWIGMLLGLANARFRDVSQFVNNAMRLVFFLTPIIWYAEMATGPRASFVMLNPFFYFIEIVRAPMLGQMPDARVWYVAILITLLGWVVALPVYARWRRQISYWV